MTSFSTASSPPIKSIQRGTVSVGYNSSSTVTINSIDTAKTFISASCENGYAQDTFLSSFWASALMSNCVLTNATTLTVSTGEGLVISGGGSAAPTLSWEVIEYA